jgi:hypothetical protein
MRKVLLATTALVAMTGVAAAEVTVNGFYEFNYTSVNDDRTKTYDTMGDDTEVHISYNDTADNGLAYGMKVEIETSATDDLGVNNDEASMYVSGDFGKITLGENDGAAEDHTLFAGNTHFMGQWGSSVPSVNSDGAGATITAGVANSLKVNNYTNYGPGDNAMKIKYNSPSMAGFSFAYSMAAQSSATDSEDTEVGVTYSTDVGGVGITLGAGMYDSGEASDSGEATFQRLSIANGDLAVHVGMSNSTSAAVAEDTTNDNNHNVNGVAVLATDMKEADGARDIDTSILVLEYALNDNTNLSAEYLNSKNGVAAEADELTATGFGISYMVAPGLKLDMTHHAYELVDGAAAAKKNDGSVTRASIKVSF